jgi:hypothetical protein
MAISPIYDPVISVLPALDLDVALLEPQRSSEIVLAGLLLLVSSLIQDRREAGGGRLCLAEVEPKG